MGKPKKGKKGQDDFGDDVDIDPLASTKDGEVDGTNKVNKKDDDLDDAADEIAAHSLEMNKGSLQEEEEGASQIAPRKKEKKKKKKQLDDEDEIDVGVAPVEAGIDRFQMLAMMEDDDVGQKESEDEDASRKDDEIVLESVGEPDAQSKSKKKKKKVKEKVKTAEEEDVEAILAALDEAGSKKKGKKAKKKEASEECLEEEIKGPVPTPEAEKSEPKVVTIDYDSEEDTKKKKKKGKKGEQAAEIKLQKVEPKVVTIDDYESEEEMKKKKKKGKNDDDEIMAKLESMGPKVVTMDDYESEEDTKKAKKKKGKKEKDVEKEGDDEADEDQEEGGTVKTAAQKKKEKKERERQKKLQQKQKQHPAKKEAEIPSDEGSKAASIERELTPQASEDAGTKATVDEDGNHEDDGEKESKKKKKKKGEKEEKPKVVNKKLAAIKEHLAKLKEEEEKRKQEEEEEERREQERIQKLEEQKRLEEERRLKKKMKKKEREERAKQEGRFLTEKQKQDRLRLNQMLQLGGGIVTKNDSATNKEDVPKKKPIYTKKKKDITPKSDEAEKSPSPIEERSISIEEAEPVEQSKVEVEVAEEEEEAETGEVKESWDAESEDENEDDEEEENEEKEAKVAAVTAAPVESEIKSEPQTKMEVQVEELSEEEEQEEESESEEESTEESDDERTPAERGRDKVMKLHEAAEKKRTTDVLRAPVVCVLGHVDTGKTKILDKLRRTNVQDGEAGGITQQIGATNVPKDAILEKTKMCKEFMKQELKLPGLLIIDTPGHESFSNLRSRGSSLCDIAVLVVDIMHGLEPQTIESINLLKQRKTPFVIALNKIDRLYQWKSNPLADVANTIKRQTPHTKAEFDERARAVILQMAEEGLNSTLYYENKNPKEYVSMVPTSAHSGDGMGNLVALICELTQTLLAKRLAYSEELHATVMEVKALPGLGTTIDVILVNGKICEGDTMVLAGTEGPIITPIRGLLMPQPMKELRVKNQYEHFKEVMAAQGVKIIAKDLEKSLAGLPLYVAHDDDEIEYYKQEVEKALEDALKSIRLSDRGVFVQASTLGSLEALLEFLRTSKIKYAGINIGPVHKKDIMKASIMLEHEPQYAVILAFDVKVEREAQELADHLGVTIFTADIIYHLFDKFTAYRTDLMRKKQEEFRHLAVFPCKLRILPQYIFNSRDPIVVGVVIEAGFLKEGTPLCVPSKEFVDIGRVSSIEFNHKQLEVAKQGQEVCIKINPTPGEAPKMFGRHFEATDMLVSKISRDSIDAVKDYFRDEMSKSDWKLIMELKRLFQIL